MYDRKSLKWALVESLLLNNDRDFSQYFRFNTNAKSKSLQNIGRFYSNNIQLDDYFSPLNLISKQNMSELPLLTDSLITDNSYRDQKSTSNLLLSKSTTPLNINSGFNYPQSHHGILNNFRDNFADFSHVQDNSLDLSDNYTLNVDSNFSNKTFFTNNNFKLLSGKNYDETNFQAN